MRSKQTDTKKEKGEKIRRKNTNYIKQTSKVRIKLKEVAQVAKVQLVGSH